MKEMAKHLKSGKHLLKHTLGNAESREKTVLSLNYRQRPIGRKRKRTRKNKMPFKGNLKAVQRLLRVKRVSNLK